MRIASVFLIALVLGGASPAAPQDRSCPGVKDGKVDPVEADQLYARRAVDIMRAALANDQTALLAQVEPTATFELWRGDYASSARNRGPAGAVEMARDLKPVMFESQTVQPGPIVVVVRDCAWEVTVLFRGDEAGRATSVRFKFRDGLLAAAVGHEVALLSGAVR